jgi:hypothetical protein
MRFLEWEGIETIGPSEAGTWPMPCRPSGDRAAATGCRA